MSRQKATSKIKSLRNFFCTLLFYAVVLGGGKKCALAFVSPDLPPDSHSHEVFSRLLTQTPFLTHLDGVATMTEAHLFHLLSEADRSLLLPAAAQDLDWLKDYLGMKGVEGEPENQTKASFGFSTGMYLTNGDDVPVLQVGARTNPLVDLEQGRFSQSGFNLWGEPRVSGRWAGILAFDAVPLLPLTVGENDTDFDPTLYVGYLKLGRRSFEMTAGRFQVDWGHGESGGFIFGGTQPPLTGLRFQNADPMTMPWFLRHLGPTQFVFLVSRLSDEQFFPHSWMVGERIVIKPARWLEMGFSQAIILGGDGAPEQSFGEAVMEVLGRRQGDVLHQNFSNRNFLGDFKVTIPKISNLSVYAEIYFEDCCGTDWARDTSNLIGIHLPMKIRNKPVLVRWEWARTTEITFRNTTFVTGFADREKILGHPIGPDANGIYLSVKLPVMQSLWLANRFAWERRGRNALDLYGNDIRLLYPPFDRPEDRYRFEIEPSYTLGKLLWIKGRLAYEFVDHYFFDEEDSKHEVLGSVSLGINF